MTARDEFVSAVQLACFLDRVGQIDDAGLASRVREAWTVYQAEAAQ